MKSVLFNLHDLVLVWISVSCCFISIFIACSKHFLSLFQNRSRAFLVVFFFLVGLKSVDTLLFWGEGVKSAAFDFFPPLLTLLSFSAFSIGPIFYWFSLSELGLNSRLHWRFALHLSLAMLTPFYLYWVFYQYPVDVQRHLIIDLAIYRSPEAYFSMFITFKKLIPFVYGLAVFRLISNIEKPDEQLLKRRRALTYFTLGYCVISGWELVTHIFGIWVPTVLSDSMGLLGNYMTITLLFSLLVVLFRASTPESAFSSSGGARSKNDAADIEAIAMLIQKTMNENRPYLNSGLTLERFSQLLSLTPRQVSMAINRHFEQNFQEYVNRHRIEESKRLLRDVNRKNLTIQEVSELSGFNSKATFNRLFKSFLSISPSEFRQEPPRSIKE